MVRITDGSKECKKTMGGFQEHFQIALATNHVMTVITTKAIIAVTKYQAFIMYHKLF